MRSGSGFTTASAVVWDTLDRLPPLGCRQRQELVRSLTITQLEALGDALLDFKGMAAIENEGNSLYLSIVSLWEITIKLSLGKLDLQLSVDEMVESFL